MTETNEIAAWWVGLTEAQQSVLREAAAGEDERLTADLVDLLSRTNCPARPYSVKWTVNDTKVDWRWNDAARRYILDN